MQRARSRRASRSASACSPSQASSSRVKIEDLTQDDDESYDELEEEEVVPVHTPRKRGRPRGSTKKRKALPEVEIVIGARNTPTRRDSNQYAKGRSTSHSNGFCGHSTAAGDFFSTLTRARPLDDEFGCASDQRNDADDSDGSFDTPPPPSDRLDAVQTPSQQATTSPKQKEDGDYTLSVAEVNSVASPERTVAPEQQAAPAPSGESDDEVVFVQHSAVSEAKPPAKQKRGKFPKGARKKLKRAATTPAKGEEEKAPPPAEPTLQSPAPQATIPDFIFAPPDEAMFEEVRKFLDRPKSDDESSESLPSGSDVDVDEYYEQRRRRKLEKNREILAKLGLGVETEEQGGPRASKSSRLEREESQGDMTGTYNDSAMSPSKRQLKVIKIAEDGTTLTLPRTGERFEVAVVDIPPLRDRVRSQFLLLEDVPEADPVEYDEWPEWDGRNAEGEELILSAAALRAAQKAERKRERDAKRAEKLARNEQATNGNAKKSSSQHSKVSAKSGKALLRRKLDFEGTSCHQCRRKTPQAKMHCSVKEDGQVCGLYFCTRCLLIRYGIEADPLRKDFVCPRCAGYCNCSRCLRDANLEQFIPESISKSLATRLKDKDGNVLHLSVKHYLDTMIGRTLMTSVPGLKPRLAWHVGGKKAKPEVIDFSDVDEEPEHVSGVRAVQEVDNVVDGAAPSRPRKIVLTMKRPGSLALPSDDKPIPSATARSNVTSSAGQAGAQLQSAPPPARSVFAKRQSAKKSNTVPHSQVWVKSAVDLSDSSSVSSDLSTDESGAEDEDEEDETLDSDGDEGIEGDDQDMDDAQCGEEEAASSMSDAESASGDSADNVDAAGAWDEMAVPLRSASDPVGSVLDGALFASDALPLPVTPDEVETALASPPDGTVSPALVMTGRLSNANSLSPAALPTVEEAMRAVSSPLKDHSTSPTPHPDDLARAELLAQLVTADTSAWVSDPHDTQELLSQS